MKKLKKVLAIALLLPAFSTTIAQAQTWNWSKSFGGKEVDYASGITNDAQGNVYLVGSFNGTASFGEKQLTTRGYYDIFLAKYSPDGKLIWLQQAGGNDLDEGNGIALDNKGNILVTGIFSDELKIKSNAIKSNGNTDIFVASYNTDGALNWIKTLGGSGKDEATAITSDNNGNAVITGWFSGTANFGKITLISAGDDDIFVAKLSNSGAILWANQAGGSENADRAYGVITDAQNNIYVTGTYKGKAKFADQIVNSVGADDCFLAKYDEKGFLLWVKSSGGKGSEIGRAIALDQSGNIYVCGDYNSTFAANSNSSTYDDWDIFIVKYDSKGFAVAGNRAGGDGYDRPISMCIDKAGNCYITGVYERNCFFGKQEIVSQGNSDIFLAKTNSFEPLRKSN